MKFSLIAAPLRIQGLFGDDGPDKVRELLRLVGLNPEHGNRYPHEFSGGQASGSAWRARYLGRTIEEAPTDALFHAPSHPYTQALISAVPFPDPRKERARERITVTGDAPNPVDPPSGCRFRTRCPKFANELTESQRRSCIEEVPALIDRGQGHASACHYAEARQLT